MTEDSGKHTDIDAAFGDLIEIRRAKPAWVLITIFTFFGLILLAPGIGLITEAAYLTGIVCVAFSLPCFWLVWFQFSLSRDELSILQNGFTYKSRGRMQKCLWQDVRSLTFASGKSNTFTVSVSSALSGSRGTLVAVRKTSEELIELNEYLRCEAEMIDAIKAFRKTERAANTTAEE